MPPTLAADRRAKTTVPFAVCRLFLFAIPLQRQCLDSGEMVIMPKQIIGIYLLRVGRQEHSTATQEAAAATNRVSTSLDLQIVLQCSLAMHNIRFVVGCCQSRRALHPGYRR